MSFCKISKRVIALVVVILMSMTFYVPARLVRAMTNETDQVATKSASMLNVIKNPTEAVNAQLVVIANPGSKGAENVNLNLEGLIDTTVQTSDNQVQSTTEPKSMPFHPESLSETVYVPTVKGDEFTASEVSKAGEVRVFNIYDDSTGKIKVIPTSFLCTAVGNNCNVWIPSDVNTSHRINKQQAETIGAEFDKNYPTMSDAFGEMRYPEHSNGKVNLMVYDINDGYDPDNGSYNYVGGFFWPNDLDANINGETMIHINTYPLIFSSNGITDTVNVSNAFSVLVHEFQHLINHMHTTSNTNGAVTTDRWLNECMSMSAEEMIYAGSAVPERLRDWYNGAARYHNGKSLYNWDNSLGAYAISCLFGQYLRVQTGGYQVFSKILDFYSTTNNPTALKAIAASVDGSVLEGMATSEINACFRIALNYANAYGIYGLHDERAFMGLHPVPATSSNISVAVGGAVTVQPSNGIFNREEWNIPDNLNCYCITSETINMDTVLHGFSNGWVKIDPKTGIATQRSSNSFNEKKVCAAEYYAENAYGYTNKEFFVANHVTLETTFKSVEQSAIDMCYDYSTDVMYALGRDSADAYRLYCVDLQTGAMTSQAMIDTNGTPCALACSTDGVLYMLSKSSGKGVLYTLDKSNGETIRVGSTDIDISSTQTLSYDHNNSILYLAQHDANSNLYVINTKTANANLIMYDMQRVTALYTIPTLDSSMQWLTYSVANGEVSITRCSRDAVGEIIIPATLEGYPVTKISNGAFASCNKITKITLPDNMLIIGSNAFASCTELSGFYIPAQVKDIGSNVFAGCTRLVNIEVDEANDNYTSVDGAIYNKNATSLIMCPVGKGGTFTVKDGTESIGKDAFRGCVFLDEIKLPNGLLNIGSNAFSGCSGIKSLALPQGVISFGEYAFSDCVMLESIEIPSTVEHINGHTFDGCKALMTVTLPDTMKTLASYMFFNCESLYNINLPASISEIGSYALSGCTDLPCITIPAEVKKIANNAFVDSTSLRAAYFLGNAPTDFGNNVFGNCASDFTVYFFENARGFEMPTWNTYNAVTVNGNEMPKPDAPVYVLGDANNDGIVNTGDAIVVLRFSVGTGTLGAIDRLAADFNTDGLINTGDATQILKRTVTN